MNSSISEKKKKKLNDIICLWKESIMLCEGKCLRLRLIVYNWFNWDLRRSEGPPAHARDLIIK